MTPTLRFFFDGGSPATGGPGQFSGILPLGIYAFLDGAGPAGTGPAAGRRRGYSYNPLWRYPVHVPPPQEIIVVLELHDAHREGEFVTVMHMDAITRVRYRMRLDAVGEVHLLMEADFSARRYAALDTTLRGAMHMDATLAVFDGGPLLLCDELDEVEA